MALETVPFFMATKKISLKIPKFYSQMKPFKIKRISVKMPKIPKFKVERIKI